MNKLQKFKDTFNNGYYKAGAVATVAILSSTNANAAINVTEVVSEIGNLDDPINKIGAAILGIVVTLFGWRMIRNAIR